MTLAERLKKFRDRGFQAETAAVLVLIEEALHSLFKAFPDTFVLFGGATSSCSMEVRGIRVTLTSCQIVMKPQKLRASSIAYRPPLLK